MNDLTWPFSNNIDDMSYPSRVTLGRGTSTSFISVGNMSRVDASWKIQSSQIQPATSDINHTITSVVVPGLILPGQLAIPGTLCPPSHVVALPQRSRPPFPPLIPQRSAGLYYIINEDAIDDLFLEPCYSIQLTHYQPWRRSMCCLPHQKTWWFPILDQLPNPVRWVRLQNRPWQ